MLRAKEYAPRVIKAKYCRSADGRDTLIHRLERELRQLRSKCAYQDILIHRQQGQRKVAQS